MKPQTADTLVETLLAGENPESQQCSAPWLKLGNGVNWTSLGVKGEQPDGSGCSAGRYGNDFQIVGGSPTWKPFGRGFPVPGTVAQWSVWGNLRKLECRIGWASKVEPDGSSAKPSTPFTLLIRVKGKQFGAQLVGSYGRYNADDTPDVTFRTFAEAEQAFIAYAKAHGGKLVKDMPRAL